MAAKIASRISARSNSERGAAATGVATGPPLAARSTSASELWHPRPCLGAHWVNAELRCPAACGQPHADPNATLCLWLGNFHRRLLG